MNLKLYLLSKIYINLFDKFKPRFVFHFILKELAQKLINFIDFFFVDLII